MSLSRFSSCTPPPIANDSEPRPVPADDKSRFINRELSWLAFNGRVADEAMNANYPLYERLRFLAISAGNLDEFYMVRIAGLKAQIKGGLSEISIDGLNAEEQLALIYPEIRRLSERQQEIWMQLRHEFEKAGVFITACKDVKPRQKSKLKEWFENHLYPVLTPITLEPAHPFPFIPNRGHVLALELKRKKNEEWETLHALVPVPVNIRRFVRLPDSAHNFLPVEEIIILFLDQLFPACKLKGAGVFRILRDSEVEIDEKAEDLMQSFESLLKRRRRGNVILLKMEERLPEKLCNAIALEAQCETEDIVIAKAMVGLESLAELIAPSPRGLQFLRYAPRHPERVRDFRGDIFRAIRAKDLLIHHPFESFDIVVDFLNQAARDPNVIAIKQTLYRTSDDSPIVKALIDAAENGKSVTALVELRARFDEEANIKWARDMERAGIQICYGFMDLKTHCKVSLVSRKERGKLCSYVHFGTGNYNPVTARLYTDFSFFTVDEALGRDATRVFNYMTSSTPPKGFEKIAVSPLNMHQTLLQHIESEIAHARAGRKAAIWVKLNHIGEPKLIDALCRAARENVSVELIVRGICCLRPELAGYSEGIRVKSIIGRFLEHARIICFGNGEGLPSSAARVFLSSADWMPRNMFRRVETLVPLENSTVKKQILQNVLDAEFRDNQNSWRLNAEGQYQRIPIPAGSLGAFPRIPIL